VVIQMNIIIKYFLKIIQKLNLDKVVYFVARTRFSNFFLSYFWDAKQNFNYFETIYNSYKKLINKKKLSLKNKKVLELGCGSSIGPGYFFIKDGIKNWVGIEKFNEFDKKFNIELIKMVIKKYPSKNYSSFFDSNFKINPKNMKFVQSDFIDFNTKEKFDCIFSNAVLEHVDKNVIEQTIQKINSLLVTGGYAIHAIDLRDHFNFDNPFNFYKYPEKEWNKLTKGTIMYTNRLRAKDFIELFKKNGFKLVYIKENIQQDKINNLKISDFFSKYSQKELSVEDIQVIYKKTRGFYELA